MIPKRIVLDTNVCLDLFVFHDPRWGSLLTALKSGAVQAVTRGDCRTEWLIVLGYPHLPLDDGARTQATADFDALITCLDAPSENSKPEVRLPVCRDQDDQKFLEVAQAAGAEWLVTKDKALLKLAGKARRAGLFAILTPNAWLLTQSFDVAVSG